MEVRWEVHAKKWGAESPDRRRDDSQDDVGDEEWKVLRWNAHGAGALH